jgi:hypothetical protein
MNSQRRSGPSQLSRRAFGRLAIGGGLTVAKHAGPNAADAHAADHFGSQTQPDVALQKLSTEARARFDSMWQGVLRKHGEKFNDEQKARIRRIVARNVAMLEAVYAVDVRNGDGPATVLRLVDGSTPRRQRSATPPKRAGGARKL